jgi:hypothetical protein
MLKYQPRHRRGRLAPTVPMAFYISETKSKANPQQRINKCEHENNGQEILDNRKLHLDLFVLHGHYYLTDGRCLQGNGTGLLKGH